MLSPSGFRAIVSGERRGFVASLWRGLFAVVEPFYAAAVRSRNRRFETNKRASHRVAVPVLSVGNLTLGGTGKTPMVEWLARWFRERGVRVVLVSRGYGGGADGVPNDEARELADKLPGVPHLQNRNRVASAHHAIIEHDAQLILLDDGFQHRRLARDCDLVLLDALEPFGFDHVFPRGTLREPVNGLRRAHVVGLSRASVLDEPSREKIRNRVYGFNPHAIWIELDHQPRCWRDLTGSQLSLAEQMPARAFVFCAIGNPAGFRHTLETLGVPIVGFQEFDDHYTFTQADLDTLKQQAEAVNADRFICTHKDLVKLTGLTAGTLPIQALEVGLEITAGREAFEARLEQLARVAIAS